MAINIITAVQENLGYPPLQKVDPNADHSNNGHDEPKPVFSQAAIPAILTAMYKYAQSDTGAEELLRGGVSTDWVSKLFHGHDQEAIQKIKSYAVEGEAYATIKLNVIASEAVGIMKENINSEDGIKGVKDFFHNQRNNILLYLPPSLQLGSLLNDDTVDDATNKMEGPVSGLMHSIGAVFSKPVTGDEIKEF